jgi:hypothetical protein
VRSVEIVSLTHRDGLTVGCRSRRARGCASYALTFLSRPSLERYQAPEA